MPRSKPRYNPRARKPSPVMTAEQYNAACEQLGLAIYGSAIVLGISLSSAQRYAAGKQAIPQVVRRLLLALVLLRSLGHSLDATAWERHISPRVGT